MSDFVVEPLGRRDRLNFTCGVDELDQYFHWQVSQDIRRRISNCFVAVTDNDEIASFYTLAAASLPMMDLPEALRKHLPRYPLLPAALLGRLAVSMHCRRRGLGAALIVDALERVVRAEPAIFALIVDAKDDTAVTFYRHLGFQPFASRAASLFLTVSKKTF